MMWHFEGYFEGAKTYAQDSSGVKKVEAPSKILRKKAPLYVSPETKYKLTLFKNQRYIGILCPYIYYIYIYNYSCTKVRGVYISKLPVSKLKIR
jgi:hypothetical protein